MIIFYHRGPKTLRSLLFTLSEWVSSYDPRDVYIIYPDNDLYVVKQYNKIKSKYQQHIFVGDSFFRRNFISIVSNPYYTHILFTKDSCIFFKPVDLCDVMTGLDSMPVLLGISLGIDLTGTKIY